MSEPFIAEIKIFAGNFAPRGYAFCDGQLLPIAQNTALFSLIGTTYGGDGRTTTALPNLEGRLAIHAGRGNGLTDRRLGSQGGTTTELITEQTMASHTHTHLAAAPIPGDDDDPTDALHGTTVGANVYAAANNLVDMHPEMVTATGGNAAHTNVQPLLGLNYIIALVGTFPSRD